MPAAQPEREGEVIYCPTRKAKVPHLARLPSHQGGVVPTPRRARRLHRRKVRGNSMQRRQIRLVSTLDELMRRRSSSTGTGNLTGGDTLAGRGAAVAGGNLIGGDTLATLAGRRAAIAASSVKRHASIYAGCKHMLH